MKKLSDLLKPNVLIFFGALLLLYYLNWLRGRNATLAIGIVAVVLSAYYLTVGILGVVLGDKFSSSLKKTFDVVSVSLFCVFTFVYILLVVIDAHQVMGPTAWTIDILSMAAALALAAVYSVSKFVDKPVVTRLAFLFAAIFTLALLLNIIFDESGWAISLGNVNILLAVIYAFFTFYLFSSLQDGEGAKERPAKEEKTEEKDEPSYEEKEI